MNVNPPFVPLAGYEQFEATTQIIIAELLRRELSFEVMDAETNLLLVHHEGKDFPIFEGTISGANSLIAYWISNDKWMTKMFLKQYGISHAKGTLLSENFKPELLQRIQLPAVVKPADTDHGTGVSVNLKNKKDLREAITLAFKYSKKVIVEEYIEGMEYRFLVIDGILRAIAYREPANVTGDGKHSIQELIDLKNENRGLDYRRPLLKIPVDAEVRRHLDEQGLNVKSILADGQKIYLRTNSNLSTGGDSIDATDDIPDFYKLAAQEAAVKLGLKIAGIDIIIKDSNKTPSHDNYIIVELNAPAMLSMHDFPYIGKNRNVASYVLDAILSSS